MSGQNIDFKNAGDTGYRTDQDAIEKYNDGEQAIQSVLNRPNENLRYRSEVLRSAGEDAKYRNDADMGWIISPGNDFGVVDPGTLMPLVEFYVDGGVGSEGLFTISDHIVLQPLGTPAVDVKETKTYSFTSGVSPTYAADVLITAELFAYEGANWREVVWEEVPAASVPSNNSQVVVEGSPLFRARIQLSDAGVTAEDLAFAVVAASAELTAAGLTITLPGTNNNATAITVPGVDAEYRMRGTREREMHYITTTAINTFFATGALADGDTLAVYYEWLEEPSGVGGRRQSTPTTERTGSPPNTEIIGGQLFNTSVNPGRIPFCIPLCKRVGDDLIFIDGTLVRDNDLQKGTVRFGENGYTKNVIEGILTTALAVVDTKWKNNVYLDGATDPWEFTTTAALNAIIGDLADVSGSNRIGLNTFSSPSSPGTQTSTLLGYLGTSSLEVNLQNLLNTVNTKPALGIAEDITGDWTFNGNVTVAGDVDYSTTSRIVFAGTPQTFLIDGFMTRPQTGGFLPNKLFITGGTAVVGGKPIVKTETVITDLEALFMTGTALPAVGESKFYYIWLRSDGTFRVNDTVSATTKQRYSVTPEATYTEDDYLLIDVIFTHNATGVAVNTDYYTCVYTDSSLRLFQEIGGADNLLLTDTESTFPANGTTTQLLTDSNMPGVPFYVSLLAQVGLVLTAFKTAATGTDVVSVRLKGMPAGILGPNGPNGYGVSQRVWNIAANDVTEGTLLTNSLNQYERTVYANTAVSGFDGLICQIYFTGFHWDRHARQ